MELRRGLDAPTLTALASRRPLHPVLFAYLDWPDGVVRAHSGAQAITWGGQSWTGVGSHGSVDVPDEMAGTAATEASVTLTGLSDAIEDRADDAIRNRTAALYMGFLADRPGEGAETLIGTPFDLFAGWMDGLSIPVEADERGLVHSAVVRIMSGQEARSPASVYHSDEDQKRHYPEDTAGRHLVHARAWAEKLRWPEN